MNYADIIRTVLERQGILGMFIEFKLDDKNLTVYFKDSAFAEYDKIQSAVKEISDIVDVSVIDDYIIGYDINN